MKIDLGVALLDAADELATVRPRLEALRDAVTAPTEFPFAKWFALYALVDAFRPDLIIELGRGHGNSTCALVEASHATGSRVVSISIDPTGIWPNDSVPRIRDVVGEDWFSPLEIVEGDLLEIDLDEMFRRAHRPFLFWDAHGADVADHILAADPPGLVAVDDVGDVRIGEPDVAWYRDHGLELVWAGDLYSAFDELPRVLTWAEHTEREVESAEAAVGRVLDGSAQARETLRSSLGLDPVSVGGLLLVDPAA